jgi:hypothetical protein
MATTTDEILITYKAFLLGLGGAPNAIDAAASLTQAYYQANAVGTVADLTDIVTQLTTIATQNTTMAAELVRLNAAGGGSAVVGNLLTMATQTTTLATRATAITTVLETVAVPAGDSTEAFQTIVITP